MCSVLTRSLRYSFSPSITVSTHLIHDHGLSWTSSYRSDDGLEGCFELLLASWTHLALNGFEHVLQCVAWDAGGAGQMVPFHEHEPFHMDEHGADLPRALLDGLFADLAGRGGRRRYASHGFLTPAPGASTTCARGRHFHCLRSHVWVTGMG